MNPLFSVEGAADLSAGAVLEPLLAVLAEELPTVENGGVSPDGRTVRSGCAPESPGPTGDR